MGPASTYRVQLRAEFGFADAADVAAYVASLGASHLYCSPYLQAAPGSTHGYDVVDPHRFNEDLGGAAGHATLVGRLRAVGLRHILDIVPNHMAVGPTNPWWWDVLENGPASRYSGYFDIDWEGPDERSAFTVLVPILDGHYGRVLEAGDLRIERRGGDFVVRYHDQVVPVSPRSIDDLIGAAARRAGSAELAELADALAALPHARLSDAAAERHDRKVDLSRRLGRLCETNHVVGAAVDAEVNALNADFDRLDALLRRQNYRLARWRTASDEIDYRRFFNIDSLVGVRVEEDAVFEDTHALILRLVREGTVDGLRVDHVDGLRDPKGYLTKLAAATDGGYTVVEKILEPDESVPADWPVAGTSGYDFLTSANNLFVASEHEGAMTRWYGDFTGECDVYDQVLYDAKHAVMATELAAEVERLTAVLSAVCVAYRRHRDHTRRELRDALCEFIACLPVYRTYVTRDRPASASDRRHVRHALAAVTDRRPDLDRELLDFMGELAVGDQHGELETEFTLRLQQLTAPVMAKGGEDTAFYRYHRLISLNEVGGDPGVFGRPATAFHTRMAATADAWPRTMLTLSTHDTKRSADVRARLNVLSELPEQWQRAVERWAASNDRHRRGGWPDRNAEYLLYQTLIGAWPIDPERVVAYMAKAAKEAKVHTSWNDPVADYDDALEAFARSILGDAAFVADLESFMTAEDLIGRGRRNSLAQTALLLTCPGVPDIYQGTELWDLTLVDPDNRRPVDYEVRRRLLEETHTEGPPVPAPREDPGTQKIWLIHRLLHHRRDRPDLYYGDRYDPLALTGTRSEDAIAFSRGDLAVVAACRSDHEWAGTEVDLPPGHWLDVLTGRGIDGGRQQLAATMAGFPAVVLARDRS